MKDKGLGKEESRKETTYGLIPEECVSPFSISVKKTRKVEWALL